MTRKQEAVGASATVPEGCLPTTTRWTRGREVYPDGQRGGDG
jgi:hypothetical protein